MQREMQRKKNKEQLIEKFEEVEENRKRKLKEFGKKKKH